MADWRWCIVALALSCAGVYGKAASSGASETIKIPVPNLDTNPSTDVTHPTTTDKPTPTPPTTPPPTTPSTTTSPTTTTTTEAPKTTTPPPKTTTSKPKPTPIPTPPSMGTWNYTDSTTNISCIVVQFAVQFNVSYAAGKETRQARFNLPKESMTKGGSCGNSSQWIKLSWPIEQDPIKQNNFTIKYEMNTTLHQYYISQVSLDLVYDADLFPNASSTENMELRSNSKEWMTGVNYSYRCKQPQTLKLTSEVEGASGNLVADVVVSNVQEEAFRSVKGHDFGIAADCETDVPDVVPIAVGCALGALVLVVLIAYMVGRRRSAARGYLSM